jgi:hypothetical protein
MGGDCGGSFCLSCRCAFAIRRYTTVGNRSMQAESCWRFSRRRYSFCASHSGPRTILEAFLARKSGSGSVSGYPTNHEIRRYSASRTATMRLNSESIDRRLDTLQSQIDLRLSPMVSRVREIGPEPFKTSQISVWWANDTVHAAHWHLGDCFVTELE